MDLTVPHTAGEFVFPIGAPPQARIGGEVGASTHLCPRFLRVGGPCPAAEQPHHWWDNLLLDRPKDERGSVDRQSLRLGSREYKVRPGIHLGMPGRTEVAPLAPRRGQAAVWMVTRRRPAVADCQGGVWQELRPELPLGG